MTFGDDGQSQDNPWPDPAKPDDRADQAAISQRDLPAIWWWMAGQPDAGRNDAWAAQCSYYEQRAAHASPLRRRWRARWI